MFMLVHVVVLAGARFACFKRVWFPELTVLWAGIRVSETGHRIESEVQVQRIR
jgi:hypothetical protein